MEPFSFRDINSNSGGWWKLPNTIIAAHVISLASFDSKTKVITMDLSNPNCDPWYYIQFTTIKIDRSQSFDHISTNSGKMLFRDDKFYPVIGAINKRLSISDHFNSKHIRPSKFNIYDLKSLTETVGKWLEK